MGQVLTNNTTLAYARESSLGVLPGSPDWKTLEPNGGPTEFGPQTTTEARSPTSKLRQLRQGTVTDTDFSLAYEADQTLDSLVDFTEAFIFATAVNADMTFRAADTLATGFTVPALTAAQAAKLQFNASGVGTLVFASGYASSTINGIHRVDIDASTSDVLIGTNTVLPVETAPANAEVSLCGIRAEDGDLALAVSSGVGTLTSGNNAATTNIDFTTLGLTVGQRIHVGGAETANRFGSTAGGTNDSFGSARITAIAAGTLTLDKLDSTLTASDGTNTGSGGTNVFVDLLFGRFVRNVSVDHADYERISHTFESTLPNLYETDPPTPVANPDGFEYMTGMVANEMAWAMPLTSKSTATFSFVGTGGDDPVDNASRKSGASAARDPLHTAAFNTSADFFRLRIEDVDETGLTSDFKDLTLTISNGTTGEKVLAQVGPKYINTSNLVVTAAGSVLFTNATVPTRIRANTRVSADWVLKNADGAVAVDIPSGVLESDGRDYPVNETVTIGLTMTAFVDPILQTSIGVSFFPLFPTS